MTEFSGWWTTSGTPSGDQVAGYTQSHLSTASKLLVAGMGFEGVLQNYLNKLGGTVTGLNTVQINTGGGVVDGKWYNNDAAVNVNVPSAVGGGNTRIDRIVLRASWSAFTVRITRIAGVDAASPTPPAITQTPGTIYDIMLYQALVDTGGNVTLTDERVVASPLTHRTGNSATNWDSYGTTVYIPPAWQMQIGFARWTGSASATGNVTVTLPDAFAGNPMVFVQPELYAAEARFICAMSVPSSSTFTIYWRDVTGATHTTVDFHYLAIGPK